MTTAIREDIFGWFDDTSDTPAHDPGVLTGKCAACGKMLDRPVQTISLMPVGGDRSYFFRTHKGCWEALCDDEKTGIESSLIDTLAGEIKL